MTDITERGLDTLKSLRKVPYSRLSTREKTDLAILSHVWDERELAGGPIDTIDTYIIMATLQRQNPLWSRSATHDRVVNTIPKLVYTKHLEEF